MKKLLTLLLTLALCVPMLMTTSVEVRAEEEENETTFHCFHGCCNTPAVAADALCSECKNPGDEGTTIVITTENAQEGTHRVLEKCTCGYIVADTEVPCEYEDGVCECGKNEPSEPEIPCPHYEFNECDPNTGGGFCDTCDPEFWTETEIYQTLMEGHARVYECGCGTYVIDDEHVEEHVMVNGQCTLCFYRPDCSSSTPSKPVTSKPAVKAPTEEEIAEQRAEAISKAVEEKIKAEEAIPVADFVSAEAVKAIPEEVKGTSTEAVFNVSKITTTRGFVAAVDKIVKENAKEKTVTFYSATPFAFNTNSLNALTNANKDFVYMFKHEGKLYKITIPAGAKIDLAGQKFAGPLYIGAQLGTSVVVK